jgi:dTDP-4-dehydrorhamnose 3,5-epimerase
LSERRGEMKVLKTAIPDVLILEPEVYGDARGWFMESYNRAEFAKAGITAEFVQDNHSRSARNVLRGLHYQLRKPQGKLVRVVTGEVVDVAVDIRRSSATFGKWVGVQLSAENKKMLWLPPGFAHGFLVLSESADFLYKVTEYRSAENERTILWNDPEIGIEWPVSGEPVLSEKDRAGASLRAAEVYE